MSAEALQIAQEIFSVWGQGGFHNAEKETNFDKYMTADIVIDYRLNTPIPELKPFDGIFVGKQGFFQNMGIHTIFDWSDMKVNFIPAPDNSVLIYMDCLPVRRANSKMSNGRMICILQSFFNEQGKIFKSIYFFHNVPVLESVYP